MSKGTVLLIGSNASRIELLGGPRRPTGYYLNELVVPTTALLQAGFAVVLATPTGAAPVLDEASRTAGHFGGSDALLQSAIEFVEKHPVMQAPRSLRSVLDEGLDRYAGIFVPGGQAPVTDLMQETELGKILRHFHEIEKPTALLCHGPIVTTTTIAQAREFRAAMMNGYIAAAENLARDWIYAGYHMTVFSNEEEAWIEDNILHAKPTFHMVDALAAAGAKVTSNRPFSPYIVQDRELITGQNPASDKPLAVALVEALERRRYSRPL